VLSRPEEFRWLAVGSVVSVGVSTVCYAGWVRGRRGHLIHWERLGKGCVGGVEKVRRRVGDSLSLRGRS
jgi:hypothetical protein